MAMAVSAFSQGQVVFNNRVVGSTLGNLDARIFGVDPAAPFTEKIGNTATGVPAGTTVYGGTLLSGTGFTAQLWAGAQGATEAQLVLCTVGGTTTFRTGNGAGIVNGTTATVPGQTVNASFQVRAWDNQGGTLDTWDKAVAANAPRGKSNIFPNAFPLGFGTVNPPNLEGLLSFQLFTQVPEPSIVGLGILGGLGLFLIRRRK